MELVPALTGFRLNCRFKASPSEAAIKALLKRE